MPGASFLQAMVPWAVKKFGFNPDKFVHELADSIIGDHYPVPDRRVPQDHQGHPVPDRQARRVPDRQAHLVPDRQARRVPDRQVHPGHQLSVVRVGVGRW